jgi:hypothetical protein
MVVGVRFGYFGFDIIFLVLEFVGNAPTTTATGSTFAENDPTISAT